MKRDRRRYPLRKVLDRFFDELGTAREKLECGHIVSVPKDFYGETFAAKRRCPKCKKQEPG